MMKRQGYGSSESNSVRCTWIIGIEKKKNSRSPLAKQKKKTWSAASRGLHTIYKHAPKTAMKNSWLASQSKKGLALPSFFLSTPAKKKIKSHFDTKPIAGHSFGNHHPLATWMRCAAQQKNVFTKKSEPNNKQKWQLRTRPYIQDTSHDVVGPKPA